MAGRDPTPQFYLSPSGLKLHPIVPGVSFSVCHAAEQWELLGISSCLVLLSKFWGGFNLQGSMVHFMVTSILHTSIPKSHATLIIESSFSSCPARLLYSKDYVYYIVSTDFPDRKGSGLKPLSYPPWWILKAPQFIKSAPVFIVCSVILINFPTHLSNIKGKFRFSSRISKRKRASKTTFAFSSQLLFYFCCVLLLDHVHPTSNCCDLSCFSISGDCAWQKDTAAAEHIRTGML